MILLILFAFFAGVVTVLSPCILPILPIVLSGSIGSGKARPYGIVTGFVLSFTFFTLALATLVKLFGISPDLLRTFSVVIVLSFGLALLVPQFQLLMERLFSKLSALAPKQNLNSGYWGGLVLGLSLGLIWTPCVGPIIASVITLAATSSVTLGSVFITLAYSLGTAIPMFFITVGGREALQRVPWLVNHTELIQKIFGVVMILTALGIFFSIDRKFQAFILQTFPQYGTGITKIEDNSLIADQLKSSLYLVGENEENSPQAPELIAGGDWFNTTPLKLADLKGKVVLIDFWTYTCINCIRTFPYTKAWYEKYKDQGFVLIGVHTPEFEFEKSSANVAKAIKDFGITYPVMQDNNYATWKAYSNRYWPAEYLIDAQGKIRHTHFGEGEYDKTEMMIQKLLKEAGNSINSSVVTMPDQTPTSRLSPETYLGSERVEFYYPTQQLKDGKQQFTLESTIPKNSFSLGGEWTITPETAVTGNAAVLNYNFTASKVFLVLRPGQTGKSQVKVFLDGKQVDASQAGEDVKNGVITIDADRLYSIINLKDKVENHILRLEFQNSGTEAFAFTFG